MNFQNPPPTEAPPEPHTQRLGIPIDKPIWVYILLGSIVIMFIVAQLVSVFAHSIIPYLPPEFYGITAYDLKGGSTNGLVLILLGASYTPLVVEGQVWRLFTAMFLHNGLTHLFFNGYALFILGLDTEWLFGRSRFIIIYILAGLFGSLVSFAFHDIALAVGASGAVFGVIGMQAYYFYKYKNIFGELGERRLSNIAIIVGINLFLGYSIEGIDNLAHLGGLVAGFLLAYPLSPNYEIVDRYTETPYVIDKSDLKSQLWAILLAVFIIVGGTFIAIGLKQ